MLKLTLYLVSIFDLILTINFSPLVIRGCQLYLLYSAPKCDNKSLFLRPNSWVVYFNSKVNCPIRDHHLDLHHGYTVSMTDWNLKRYPGTFWIAIRHRNGNLWPFDWNSRAILWYGAVPSAIFLKFALLEKL